MKDETTYLHANVLQNLMDGDEQALQEIIHLFRHNLLLKAYRLLGEAEEASDAVQEVFIKLWDARNKLHSDTILEKYLNTLIKHHCLSCLRKRKVLKARTEKFMYGQTLHSNVKPMENAELSKHLTVAINSLTERQRLIFESVYAEGKTHLEIMQELQLEQQTVKNTISSALKKLRLSLEFWTK